MIVSDFQDELCRRIDEVSRYVSIEDLALSPPCGFASTAASNLLTEAEQCRKLELVVIRENTEGYESGTAGSFKHRRRACRPN